MHRHHLCLRPAAEIVNRPCDELLACAAFSLDQNGGACRRYLLNRFQDWLQCIRFAQDALDGKLLLDLLLERLVLVLQVPAAECPLHQEFHFIEIQRFGDKMICPAPHRLHGGVDAAIGGHHDAHRRLRHCQRLFEQLHPIVFTESQIGEHHVDLVILQELQRLRCIRGDIAVEIILQRQTQSVPGMLFIIDDENCGEVGHGLKLWQATDTNASTIPSSMTIFMLRQNRFLQAVQAKARRHGASSVV